MSEQKDNQHELEINYQSYSMLKDIHKHALENDLEVVRLRASIKTGKVSPDNAEGEAVPIDVGFLGYVLEYSEELYPEWKEDYRLAKEKRKEYRENLKRRTEGG